MFSAHCSPPLIMDLFLRSSVKAVMFLRQSLNPLIDNCNRTGPVVALLPLCPLRSFCSFPGKIYKFKSRSFRAEKHKCRVVIYSHLVSHSRMPVAKRRRKLAAVIAIWFPFPTDMLSKRDWRAMQPSFFHYANAETAWAVAWHSVRKAVGGKRLCRPVLSHNFHFTQSSASGWSWDWLNPCQNSKQHTDRTRFVPLGSSRRPWKCFTNQTRFLRAWLGVSYE